MFSRRPLSALVDRHVGGGTPSRSDSKFWGGSVPWASVKDFRDDELTLEATEESITDAGLRASTSNLIPPGTPIVCTRMAVGRVATARVPVAINQDLRALFPTTDTDSRYLLRLTDSLQPRAEAQAVGSTVKGIRTRDLLAMLVPIAPSSEQTLIAHILDTLDTQIRRTEEVIAKLEQVKQGLLTDLLTRGIDENGELRLPPEEAPHLYQDSALGPIPKDWEALELRALGKFNNGLNKPKEAFGSGTRFINISDVYPDHLDPPALGRVQVTAGELATYAAEVGDIFIDRSSVKLEGVGYPTVFEGSDEPVVYSGFIIRFRLEDESRILPRFLCYQMRSHAFRTEVFKVATKSANVNVNQVALSALMVGVPSSDEQRAIVAKQQALDARVGTEREKAQQLRRMKAGLMNDLLTGRVSVTPLLEGAEQAAG